jgi:hypothetical protein
MKALRRTAALLGLALVLLAANIAIAHDWWFWHQHKRTIGINITAANANSAEAARADWSAGFNVMNLVSVPDHSDVSVLDGDFGDTGWGGLAEIISYFSHCHEFDAFGVCIQAFPGITHAHVRLNTFYAWANLNTGSVFDAGRGVFCQEIGHALGLDHSPDGCMGKGYFAGLNNNETISNVVTSHSDSDLNAKYSSAPLGAVCVPGPAEVAC